MTDLPALNVVIVAYGSPELLERCLRTLGGGLSVLIVDNSSSSQVRDIAAQHGCRYVDPTVNLGFAAGVNRALTELGPQHDDVLLVNPDARLSRADAVALQQHVRALGNERVACAAPALMGPDGRAEQVEWPFPSPARAWLEALALGSFGQGRGGFLVGAVLLLRGEALDAVGTFDERFFLYAEETDWQRRAVKDGWSVRCFPELVAEHDGAGTSSDDDRRQTLFHASVEQYIRKWYGSVGWQTFRAGALLGAGIRSVVAKPGAPHRDRFARYRRGPVRCVESLGPES